jgi:hypothetical protein
MVEAFDSLQSRGIGAQNGRKKDSQHRNNNLIAIMPLPPWRRPTHCSMEACQQETQPFPPADYGVTMPA